MVVPISISCFNTIIVENYRLYYVLLHVCYDWCIVAKNFEFEIELNLVYIFCTCWNYSLYNYTPLPNVDKTMSFFRHHAPYFLFSAPSKWNIFFRITEIGAHKLRLHAPFTMDIIKGRLLFDAFSDAFMSCICFANAVNICGNKHIFIVIFIVSFIVIVIGFQNYILFLFQIEIYSVHLAISRLCLWKKGPPWKVC